MPYGIRGSVNDVFRIYMNYGRSLHLISTRRCVSGPYIPILWVFRSISWPASCALIPHHQSSRRSLSILSGVVVEMPWSASAPTRSLQLPIGHCCSHSSPCISVSMLPHFVRGPVAYASACPRVSQKGASIERTHPDLRAGLLPVLGRQGSRQRGR